jgi:hypothetical protein
MLAGLEQAKASDDPNSNDDNNNDEIQKNDDIVNVNRIPNELVRFTLVN